MSQHTFTRKVKYEKELQRNLAAEVLAIPVSDPLTFSAEMSPEVEARVDSATERARSIVEAWIPARLGTASY